MNIFLMFQMQSYWVQIHDDSVVVRVKEYTNSKTLIKHNHAALACFGIKRIEMHRSCTVQNFSGK